MLLNVAAATEKQKSSRKMWTTASLKVQQTRGKRKAHQAATDPLFTIIAQLPGLPTAKQEVVAGLISHFKSSTDLDPLLDASQWANEKSKSDDGVTAEPTGRSILLDSAGKILRALCKREGVKAISEIVLDAMLATESRHNVSRALMTAMSEDYRDTSTVVVPLSDGLSQPHQVTQTQYLPAVVNFFNGAYANREPIEATVHGLAHWYDPRGVPTWEDGKNGPIRALLGNCKTMNEVHSYSQDPEVVYPLYAYSHTMYEKVVYALWLPPSGTTFAEASTTPSHSWKPLEKSAGLNDAFTRRKFLDGLHLTTEAADEIGSSLPVQDKLPMGMALTGGRFGYGELCLFTTCHGCTIFRHSLASALPSGLDAIILLRYENIYTEDWLPEEDPEEVVKENAAPKEKYLSPLWDSVAWVPPLAQGVRPCAFRFGDLPPSSVLEYIFARRFDEILGPGGETEWRALPVLSPPVAKLLTECRSAENAEKFREDIYNNALELVSDYPQPISVVQNICWRPVSALASWEAVTQAEAAMLAQKEIREDHHMLSWMPVGEVLIEENVSKADLGAAWLLSIEQPFSVLKVEGSCIYTNGRALKLNWKSKGIFGMLGTAGVTEVPASAHDDCCYAAGLLQKKKAHTAAQLHPDGKIVFVDIGNTATVTRSTDKSCLVLKSTPLDPRDITRHFKRIFMRKLEGKPTPTPNEIANALSVHQLSYGSQRYFAAFTGEPYVLCDADSGELCVLTRVFRQLTDQPAALVNDTMRTIQDERSKAELVVDTTTHAEASQSFFAEFNPLTHNKADPASLRSEFRSHKGATALWTDDAARGGHWTLHLPDRVCVDAKEAVLHRNGFMAHQMRAFVASIADALSTLRSSDDQGRRERDLCVYRVQPEMHLADRYNRSSVILWGSLSVGSTDLSVLSRAGGETKPKNSGATIKESVFKIHAAGGCDVCKWSRFARNADYLFPANSKFQVVGVTTTGGDGNAQVCSQRFELAELEPAKALEVFVRSIIPMLTHSRAPELIWELFRIMSALESRNFKEALKIASFPSHGVLLDCVIPNEIPDATPASVGITIARELFKIMTPLQGTEVLNRALFQACSGDGCPAAVSPLVALGANPNAVDDTGSRPLHLASAGRVNVFNVITELIKAGADPTLHKETGDTPLHIVACNAALDFAGNKDVLKLLTEGTLLNIGDSKGVSPLQRAADKGVEEAVRALLELGADPNVLATPSMIRTNANPIAVVVNSLKGKAEAATTPTSRAAKAIQRHLTPRSHGKRVPIVCTALQAAAYRGYLSITNILLDYGADPDLTNKDGQTVLFLGVASGAFTNAQGLEILARLSTLKTVVKSDKHKVTPLHYAASIGELDIVKVLLATPGAGEHDIVNARDPSGFTPLRAAAQGFQLDVVLFLLPFSKVGLNPKDFPLNKVTGASDTLIRAVLNVECEKVSLLINCGVSTDVEHEGMPLLHLVCSKSEFSSEAGLKVVERLCLLPHVIRDSRGLTPIHVAVIREHKDICKVLLRLNMDPNIGDSEGKSAAHYAAEHNKLDMLSILLWYNRVHRRIAVDINAQDKMGRTALYFASEVGASRVVSLLLKENADASIKNHQGYTPAKIAVMNQQLDIVRMLPSSEGKLNLPIQQAREMLYAAIEEGHLHEVLRLLETFSINLAVLSTAEQSPLHLAVSRVAFNTMDGAEALKQLVTPDTINSTMTTEVGANMTALHIAAKKNHHYLVQTLLTAGADPETESEKGITPIKLAAHEVSVESVLLLQDVSKGKLTPRDFPLSALHRAAETGRLPAVRMLLDYGADPFEADCFAGTPSGRAFVDIKVKEGGNLVGSLPIHYAVAREEFCGRGIEVFKQLAKSKVATTSATLHQRSTALHLCGYYWHDTCSMARVLLDNGADPHAVDSSGNTPLHVAVSNGLIQLIKLLLQHTQPLPQPLDLSVYDHWANNEVIVLSSKEKAEALCDEWVQEAPETDKRTTDPTTVEIDRVRWCPAKIPYLGRKGCVMVARKGFLNIEFKKKKRTGAADMLKGAVFTRKERDDSSEVDLHTQCFPRSTVIRLTQENEKKLLGSSVLSSLAASDIVVATPRIEAEGSADEQESNLFSETSFLL